MECVYLDVGGGYEGFRGSLLQEGTHGEDDGVL